MFRFKDRPQYAYISLEVLFRLFKEDWVVRNKGCLHKNCRLEVDWATCAVHVHKSLWWCIKAHEAFFDNHVSSSTPLAYYKPSGRVGFLIYGSKILHF